MRIEHRTMSRRPAAGRRSSRRRQVAAIVIAVLVAGVTAATPAVAAPQTTSATALSAQSQDAVPGGFGTWAQFYSVQRRLDLAAIQIMAADGQGRAGIVVSAAQREVQVYWKGQVPASLRAAAARLGVTVQFMSARYTQRELQIEAKRVAVDPRVATVAPKADGSGLAVTVTTTRLSAADILGTARYPLSVTAGPRPQSLKGRQADVPNFWGGSRYWNNQTGDGCSNGFAVQVPGDTRFSHHTYITAGHCGTDGQTVEIPGQPNPSGSVSGDVTSRDTLLIHYSAGGVAPTIFTGPFDSVVPGSNPDSTATGAISDFVGDVVCTGGASSGEHCGEQVQAVDQFVNIGYVIGPETQAALPAGQCAVAPGDSGGPAYSYYAQYDVWPRGTISAGNLGTATCPGIVANGSDVVWYAALQRPAGDAQIGSLQYYGITIL